MYAWEVAAVIQAVWCLNERQTRAFGRHLYKFTAHYLSSTDGDIPTVFDLLISDIYMFQIRISGHDQVPSHVETFQPTCGPNIRSSELHLNDLLLLVVYSLHVRHSANLGVTGSKWKQRLEGSWQESGSTGADCWQGDLGCRTQVWHSPTQGQQGVICSKLDVSHQPWGPEEVLEWSGVGKHAKYKPTAYSCPCLWKDMLQ